MKMITFNAKIMQMSTFSSHFWISAHETTILFEIKAVNKLYLILTEQKLDSNS